MVEHGFCKPEVIGSSPVSSSTPRWPNGKARVCKTLFSWFDSNTGLQWGYSSVGRASVLHTECHRFESGYLHQGEVVELVYTTDLKSVGRRVHAGSNPAFATVLNYERLARRF